MLASVKICVIRAICGFQILHIQLELGIEPACVFFQQIVFLTGEMVNDVDSATNVVVGKSKLRVYIVFGYIHFK